jgi:hypothetical protein
VFFGKLLCPSQLLAAHGVGVLAGEEENLRHGAKF